MAININIPLRLGKSREEKERDRERDEAAAWADSIGLKDQYPDIYENVKSGRMGINAAANAVNQKQEKEKSDRAKQDQKIRDLSEKTLGLANRSLEDPNAGRGEPELSPFRARPAGQPVPTVESRLIQTPDADVVEQLRDVQSAYPGISKTERLDPVRARMRPGDEGLAGVAGRSIGAAKSRDEERIKKLQNQTLAIVGQGKTPLSPQQVGQGGGTFEQSLKYGGMTGEEMQRRAREGQPSEGPKWSKEDQQVVRVLGQQGIKEDSPEFPQAFLDAKKRGGVTATQVRAREERQKFLEIEKTADQIFPPQPKDRYGKKVDDPHEDARRQWIRNAKLDYLKQNPLQDDPLQAQFDQLTERLRQIDAEIDAEMQQ